MSGIRRAIRGAALKGSLAWAFVESVAKSSATVRLAANGARLTNLQMLAPVKVGQRVIVDFAAEDKPTVRPYTTSAAEVVEEETFAEAPKIEAPTDKAEYSDPKLRSYLVAGQVLKEEDFEHTFTYVGEWYTKVGVAFPFDRVSYDWGQQWNGEGVFIRYPGRYMCSIRIAMTYVDDIDYSSVKLGLTVENQTAGPNRTQYGWSLGYIQGVQVERWHDPASEIILLHWQGFVTANEGAVMQPEIRVEGRWSGRYRTVGLPVTFPQSGGVYPAFQWWRVCPMIGPQSFPYWFYNQWAA